VALGLYVSVPFCRTKCSYCNFASDVFSRAVFNRYVDRLCSDIENAQAAAQTMGGIFDRNVDSIYLGGGTPTVLDSSQLRKIFNAIRHNFSIQPDAEVTVESAPGTLAPTVVETLLACGANRVSLGVQSFVDQEAAAVGRLHKRSTVISEIDLLRRQGIANINVDLIAGLPHQTAQSWRISLDALLETGVPHASVYMLEIDDESRLGRELIAGGTRYHAHFVPDENLTADLYESACELLNADGIAQYEISNFARPGSESRHNLKYWTRQPYLGFGVDAHSMLPAPNQDPRPNTDTMLDAVRFSTIDHLETYVAGAPLTRTEISHRAALEEEFFLGLRLNAGVNLDRLRAQYSPGLMDDVLSAASDAITAGLLEYHDQRLRLTPRGRLLSNEVFASLLASRAEA
jgi:oxygen-independent coproporphyrinogen III oxidase